MLVSSTLVAPSLLDLSRQAVCTHQPSSQAARHCLPRGPSEVLNAARPGLPSTVRVLHAPPWWWRRRRWWCWVVVVVVVVAWSWRKEDEEEVVVVAEWYGVLEKHHCVHSLPPFFCLCYLWLCYIVPIPPVT